MHRKNQLEIINLIFAKLDPLEECNLGQLSDKTAVDYKTLKDYLDLIRIIQMQPKVLVKTTGHQYHLKLESYAKLGDENS